MADQDDHRLYTERELARVSKELAEMRSVHMQREMDHGHVKLEFDRLLTVINDLPRRSDFDGVSRALDEMELRQKRLLDGQRILAFRVVGLCVATSAAAGGIKNVEIISAWFGF